jgi:hypothetical protein
VLVPGLEEQHRFLEDLVDEAEGALEDLPGARLDGELIAVEEPFKGLQEIPEQVEQLGLGEQSARLGQDLQFMAFEMRDRKGWHGASSFG